MNHTQLRQQASLQSRGESSNKIHEAIIDTIKELKGGTSKSVADIGCGTGVLLRKLYLELKSSKFFGLDLTNFIKPIPDWLTFQKCDLNAHFGNSNHKFDLVISSEVIEHLENPRHFIRELAALTNPNGYIILSTPNPESYRSILSFLLRSYHIAFGPRNYPAHITALTLYDIQNIISENNSLKLVSHCFIKNGIIPKTKFHWHSLFPFLTGKRFSDNYVVTIQRIT